MIAFPFCSLIYGNLVFYRTAGFARAASTHQRRVKKQFAIGVYSAIVSATLWQLLRMRRGFVP
jgi:hypothetical protein